MGRIPFNLHVVSYYGTTGQITVNKMFESLQSSSLLLTFNEVTKKFTIRGSSNLDKNSIISIIFKNRKYESWKPEVLGVDENGDRLMQLTPDIANDRIRRFSRDDALNAALGDLQRRTHLEFV